MEFPEKSVTVERALTAAVFAAVLAVVWVESRSTAAACVRAGKPWATVVAFEAELDAPKLYLALFHPGKHTADLVYIPDSTKLSDGRKLSAVRDDALANDADSASAAKDEEDAAHELLAPLLKLDEEGGADRCVYAKVPRPAETDPALQGAAWLRRLPLRLLGTGARADFRRSDRLVAAAELARLGPGELRPAWLPEDEDARRAFLGRLGAETPLPPVDHPTVEVLNASGKRGLAQDATKILRSGGADVMSSSNAPERAGRTIVYDRSGDFGNALLVKRLLGCRQAEAVSRPEAKRLVDVTVVLADDCF